MPTAQYNWRGGEGSQTDWRTDDLTAIDDWSQGTTVVKAHRFTEPSTGLIYMQARYYEPETGRFTQPDPLPYGPETMLTGQNNRWVYCANDPVNCSDPSGLAPISPNDIRMALAGFVALAGSAVAASGSVWTGLGISAAGFAGGLPTSILAGVGSFLGAGLSAAWSGIAAIGAFLANPLVLVMLATILVVALLTWAVYSMVSDTTSRGDGCYREPEFVSG